MKKLKLFLALLATVFSVFAGSKAFADDTYSITIPNPNYDSNGALVGDGTTYNFAGRTYEAYEIFKGTYANTSEGETLTAITWGDGINEAGKKALASNYGVADFNDAEAVSKALQKSVDDNQDNGAKFAAIVGALNADASAYNYLTSPKASAAETTAETKAATISGLTGGYYFVADKLGTLSGDHAAYSQYILQVVGDTSVDTTRKLSIPSVEKKVKGYDDTELVETNWQDSAVWDLNDNVPFQLTASLPTKFADYEEYYLSFHDTLSQALVYEQGSAKVYIVNGSTRQDVTSKFKVTESGKNVNFTINNLKSIATDDSGAAVTITSSTKVVVEYEAKLTDNGLVVGAENDKKGNINTVYLEYSNNPNWTGSGEDSPKGETPDDVVTVFTFKLTVDKVNEAGTLLSGAEFTLHKMVKDGNTYVKSSQAITLAKSENDARFTAVGLDSGIYVLEETQAPVGYNKLSKPVYFKVVTTKQEDSADPRLTTVNIVRLNDDFTEQSEGQKDVNVDFEPNYGDMTATIVNGKGSKLPETGSVGTRILYALGSILVIAAGVLLVTKKRMEVK
ncbi:SpaA isopeptide-forming pilin-related protein [Streptococcus henryi]|uniref:SpaA isopeptide-forming pilin-related protein n=1 Tax=Streptococcus henryi TaxID=439219 RepID=UPI000374B8DD|nr:SpaA isopeptide-forming pilin-related protein [Streptococcus henryi]